MDTERWEQLQAIFHQVVDLPPGEQDDAVTAACEGNDELRAQVLQLLEGDARPSGAVDGDLSGVAGEVFDSPWSLSPSSDRLGPYRILAMIKEGGMGVVYLAERTDVGQRVAIKVLRDAWVSPSRRARFAIEQRTLARLNHRSIARLYDVDTLEEGTPFFVMELVDGASITEHCRRSDSSVAERLRLFRDVCEAVQHAHQHLIVHRDLKPSNILVTPAGQVKLLDFGISKEIESLGAPADQTQLYRMMTPEYAAPEQLRGEEIGVYTDVYALGVILHELLAGELPSRTNPAGPSVAARKTSWGRSAGRASWAELDVLCACAMHADVGRRYATVDALIRDVDHFLNDQPLDARPDTWSYRSSKFMSRHSGAVAASAAVIALVAGLVGFYTFRLATARNAALAEAARTRRIQGFMLSLFNADDTDAAPAAEMKVVTIVDRGVLEARALDREPAVQAALLQTLGRVYEGMGRLDRAEVLLSQALDERRSALGENHGDVADSLVSLGLLKVEQAKFADAERLISDGLRIANRTLPKLDPVVARATAALGKVHEAQGAYGRAIPILEESVRLYSEAGETGTDRAAAMTELANAHFYAGHLDESDAINRRVLDMDRQLRGSGHPNVADDLLNLAAVQSSLGRYAEAEKFDREAVQILTAWYGTSHPQTASAMTILAQALTYQARLDEAAALLEQALATQEHAYGPAHPRVAFVLNEIGNVAMQRKAYDQALAAFERSLDINRAIYRGGPHFKLGVALSNLGNARLARGDYRSAEPLLHEAIGVLTATQGAGHTNTGVAEARLGRALVREGRLSEAQPHLLAGYQVLAAHPGASSTSLRAAREDLAVVMDGLREPEKAQRYRDELNDATHAQGVSVKSSNGAQ